MHFKQTTKSIAPIRHHGNWHCKVPHKICKHFESLSPKYFVRVKLITLSKMLFENNHHSLPQQMSRCCTHTTWPHAIVQSFKRSKLIDDYFLFWFAPDRSVYVNWNWTKTKMKIGRIHQYHHDLVNVRVYQPQQQHLLPSHKNMIQIIFMNRSTIPFHSRLMLNSMSIMPLSKMQTIRSCGVHPSIYSFQSNHTTNDTKWKDKRNYTFKKKKKTKKQQNWKSTKNNEGPLNATFEKT